MLATFPLRYKSPHFLVLLFLPAPLTPPLPPLAHFHQSPVLSVSLSTFPFACLFSKFHPISSLSAALHPSIVTPSFPTIISRSPTLRLHFLCSTNGKTPYLSPPPCHLSTATLSFPFLHLPFPASLSLSLAPFNTSRDPVSISLHPLSSPLSPLNPYQHLQLKLFPLHAFTSPSFYLLQPPTSPSKAFSASVCRCVRLLGRRITKLHLNFLYSTNIHVRVTSP